MVRVGVIGCGYWGPNVIRNLSELPDCRVVWAADLKPGRLSYIGQRYPWIELTTHYTQILQDPTIDAVCIVTPPQTHPAFVKEALLAGKHVFVEKPLACTVAEAEEVVGLAEQQGKVLMVGQIFEYSPAVQKLKELIASGEVGEVYYIDSTRINLGPPAARVSVLYDLAPHDLSIIFTLKETEAEAICAVGQSYSRNGLEDMAYVTLRFGDGSLGHIHVSWLAPCKLRKTYVVGSKKVVVFDDTESVEKVKVFGEGFDNRVGAEDFGEFQLTYRAGDIYIPYLDNREPLQLECQDFLDSIRKGRSPRSDGRSGLRIVRALEAAERSIRAGGKWVQV